MSGRADNVTTAVPTAKELDGLRSSREPARAFRVLPGGIQARLALVLVLACLPAIAVFAVYAGYRLQEGQQDAVEQLQRQAGLIASVRGTLLDETDTLLRSLASLPQLQNMQRDPAACDEVLARTLQRSPHYANIAVADTRGIVICRGLAFRPAKPIDVSDREWFKRVMAREDFIVGNYAVGRASGEESVHTAYPLYNDRQQLIGAVNAGIRLSWLSERFTQLNLPEGMVLALFDADGRVLIRRPRSPDPGHAIPEAARLIAEEGRGTTEIRMLDGVFRTVAFEPLGGHQWGGLTVVVAAEPRYLWRPVQRLVAIQAVTLALILLLVLTGAIAGMHWMVVRPVRSLQSALEAYTAGDRSVRAEESDRGELGGLARSFNAMAGILQRQEHALQRSVAQKRRYLAIASHDLRQPLQTMMLGLESGIEGARGSARARLERSQRAGERLQTQLDELADVVRADISANGMQPRIRAVPVSEVLGAIDEQYRADAVSKGLAFRVVHSSLVLSTDPEALRVIIGNLVKNAVAYTVAGRILVGCRRAGTRCRIEVHDTGPGIPAAERAAVFEAFRRLEPRGAPGLGLGLTIVKETASFLGCSVYLHSIPGKGSCFCVEVPLWDRTRALR